MLRSSRRVPPAMIVPSVAIARAAALCTRLVEMITVLAAYDGNAWVDWSWVGDHGDDILSRLREHATLTGWALVLGPRDRLPARVASRPASARCAPSCSA